MSIRGRHVCVSLLFARGRHLLCWTGYTLGLPRILVFLLSSYNIMAFVIIIFSLVLVNYLGPKYNTGREVKHVSWSRDGEDR